LAASVIVRIDGRPLGDMIASSFGYLCVSEPQMLASPN